jgi:hypothetical protein
MSATRQLARAHVQTTAERRKSEKLDYVRQMLRELRDMMAAEDEEFLNYLIAMAYVETTDVSRERFRLRPYS